MTETKPENKPTTFIITGMHRSGTSLASSLIQSSGVDIGRKLLGANISNPKGHFENLDFINFHECVLNSQSLSQEGWTTQNNIYVSQQLMDQASLIITENSKKNHWGWKDPRTVLFLDFWIDLLPQAYFIFMYREPWEVIDSLYRRGDHAFYRDPKYALLVWMHYNKNILALYDRYPHQCILLNAHDLIEDYTLISKLCDHKFGVALKEPSEGIIDKSLMNHSASNSHRQMIVRKFFPEAVELFELLNAQADAQSRQVYLDVSESNFRDYILQDWLDVYKTKSQLQLTQSELVESQSQLQLTQSELENSKLQLQQTQSKLKNSKLQLQQTQSELENSNSQVYGLQTTTTWMETSKFWRLRKLWFKLKRILLTPAIDSSPPVSSPDNISITEKNIDTPKDRMITNELVYELFQSMYSKELKRVSVISRLEISNFYSQNIGKKAFEFISNSAYLSCDTPSVSVIITLFNYSQYIIECLNSVTKSLHSLIPGGFEILVIDDASTDNSVNIVEEYMEKSDSAIRLIKKSLNTGLADARNTGVRTSRGSYFFVLDADNLIEPSCLQEMYQEIVGSDYAAVYSSISRFNSESGEKIGLLSSSPWDIKHLIRNPYIDAMAMFDRSKAVNAGLYSTDLIYYGWFGWEDYDLWLKFAQLDYKCKFIPQVLCSYRVHKASMIHTTNNYAHNLAKHFKDKFADLVSQYADGETIFGFDCRDILDQ